MISIESFWLVRDLVQAAAIIESELFVCVVTDGKSEMGFRTTEKAERT